MEKRVGVDEANGITKKLQGEINYIKAFEHWLKNELVPSHFGIYFKITMKTVE